MFLQCSTPYISRYNPPQRRYGLELKVKKLSTMSKRTHIQIVPYEGFSSITEDLQKRCGPPLNEGYGSPCHTPACSLIDRGRLPPIVALQQTKDTQYALISYSICAVCFSP